jgi:hypothetical protein
VDGRVKPGHDGLLLSFSCGYFLVQCPKMAKDDGLEVMPPVNEPSSSEMVAFQVS